MAEWYVSSAKYATLTAWAATTAYVVGDIRKPTAPATNAQYVFRCTTAGTSAGSEPTWSSAAANNATRTDGTVTWTNVTGQSTYGWNAACGTIQTIENTRPVAGDKVYLSSDHSESIAGAINYRLNALTHAFGLIQFISVNRSGSTPPTSSDILNGATLASGSGGNITIEAYCNLFWQGVTFSSAASIIFNANGMKAQYFKDCAFLFNNATTTSRMSATLACRAIFDNTTVQFGNASQAIAPGSTGALDLVWMNTASAIVGATLPTSLFINAAAGSLLVTARGVDLSAVTGTLVTTSAGNSIKVLLDSCKIASGVTRYSSPASTGNAHDEIELVNCYDGTNIINERYSPMGALTIDRSTTLSGGAQDDVGNYSLKMVSTARSDKFTSPFDYFWLDVENTATGSSKTATVEIISSASLNDDDISLLLEYMGTSSSSVASLSSTLPTILTTGSALTTSSVTWNNPPGTPQKQYLQVTFTPQTAGRVRGLVRLGKASTTVWVNPQITIT